MGKGTDAGDRRPERAVGARCAAALACRLVLSVLFLYSGGVKLVDLEGFAQSIYGYQLAPAWAITPAAYVLPWLEIWCALALWVAPPFRRAAWIWVTFLLVVFTVAKTSAMLRGLDISCGCTGSDDPMTWRGVAANLVWLVFAVGGLLCDRRGMPVLRAWRDAFRFSGK